MLEKIAATQILSSVSIRWNADFSSVSVGCTLFDTVANLRTTKLQFGGGQWHYRTLYCHKAADVRAVCLQTLQIRQGASDRWKKISVTQSTYSLLRHDNYFLWTPSDIGVTWGGVARNGKMHPTPHKPFFLIFLYRLQQGQLQKLGWEWVKGIYVYYGLVQTNLSRLYKLTPS